LFYSIITALFTLIYCAFTRVLPWEEAKLQETTVDLGGGELYCHEICLLRLIPFVIAFGKGKEELAEEE